MVVYTNTRPMKHETSMTSDSYTSARSNKTMMSDIYGSGKTLYDKDIEDGILSSHDDDEVLYLSLHDIVNREATSRENKLYALLLRPETLDLFEEISTDEDAVDYSAISAIIFQSNAHLFAFVELVTENLIQFDDGRLIFTPLCHRIMTSIAEDWGHDQS